MEVLKKWWRTYPKGYEVIIPKVQMLACHCFALLVFWAFFTHLYIWFNGKGDEEAIGVIFNLNLLLFVGINLVIFSALSYFSNYKTLKWVAETFFDTFFVLFFIGAVGVSRGIFEIPFLNINSAVLFISSFVFSFFCLLIHRLFISVNKNTPNRKTAIIGCAVVVIISVFVFMYVKLTS